MAKNYLGTDLTAWDPNDPNNKGKARPLSSYATQEDYIGDYANRFSAERGQLEAQPGMGIPQDIQDNMLKKGGEAVAAQGQKFGILKSGETVGGLENMTSQIALQDYMTKEGNVNTAMGTQTDLEQTSLKNAYDKAIAEQDFARAEELQQEMARSQQQTSNQTGWLGLAGDVLNFFGLQGGKNG